MPLVFLFKAVQFSQTVLIDWNCIYQKEMNNEYDMCSKSIDTKAVFSKRENDNNGWNIHFH